MSIEARYVAVCDECHLPHMLAWEYPQPTTPEEARTRALGDGWQEWGDLIHCPRCWAVLTCAEWGHVWKFWHPAFPEYGYEATDVCGRCKELRVHVGGVA